MPKGVMRFREHRLFKVWGKDMFLSRFSDEKLLIDQLFYFAFYICVGLLPPLLGIFGHKALHLPLLFISTLIILRFFMRPQCREKMTSGLSMPAVRLLIGLIIVLGIYAVAAMLSHPDRARLLGKPVIFLMTTVLLVFVWTHLDSLKAKLAFKLSLAGVLAGLVVTGLKIVTVYSLGIGYQHEIGIFTNFLQLDKAINNELRILSVLVFCAVLGIIPSQKRTIWLVGLMAIIALVSFNVAGFRYSGDRAIIGDGTYSETVQFGLLLSLVVLVFSTLAPKAMTNLWFAGMAFVLVNSPWLFQIWFRFVEVVPLPKIEKFLVRGEIWDGVANKILEAPVWGYGIDSTRYLRIIDLANDYMPEGNLRHPHNMFLQIWLDLGLLGVVLVVGLIYVSWRTISMIKASTRPVILAGISILTFMALVSHSIWQTWSIALMTFFVVLVSLSMPAEKMSQSLKEETL